MLQVKRGDTLPSLELILTDDGYPVDLSAAVVRVVGSMGATVVFDEEVTGDETGILVRDWKAGETDVVGLMRVEAVVTWPSGQRSFPVPSFAEVKIVERGPRNS